MAQEITVIHQVRSGITSEYQASFTPESSGDVLVMSFEGTVTIDNIILTTPTGSVFSLDLDLLYPASEKKLNLLNDKSISGASVWTMNARYATFGTAETGKQWFTVPSGTSLKCTMNSVTTGKQLTVLAIGV